MTFFKKRVNYNILFKILNNNGDGVIKKINLFLFVFYCVTLFASDNQDYQKAEGFFNKGKYFKAIEIYKKLQSTVSTNNKEFQGKIDYKLCVCYYYNWDIPKAIKEFKKFLKTYPKSKYKEKTLNYLAELYYNKKDFKKALEYYEQLKDEFKTSRNYKKYLKKIKDCKI